MWRGAAALLWRIADLLGQRCGTNTAAPAAQRQPGVPEAGTNIALVNASVAYTYR